MKLLNKLYEQDFEGAIYSFNDGYIVIVYTCREVEDKVYFTTDLKAAKEAIGMYEED